MQTTASHTPQSIADDALDIDRAARDARAAAEMALRKCIDSAVALDHLEAAHATNAAALHAAHTAHVELFADLNDAVHAAARGAVAAERAAASAAPQSEAA